MCRTFKPLLLLLQDILWRQRLAFDRPIQGLRIWFPGMSGGCEFQKRYQIGHIELMHRMVDESKYIMLIQTIVTDCVHM